MLCDMCGKDTKLSKYSIEGTVLNVCSVCGKYGQKFDESRGLAYPKKKRFKEDISKPVEMVIPDFSRLIKNKRESMNLTQEQLAKRLNEKESMIQSIEKGRMPSIAFAKKLEKNMDIVLVKEYKNSHAELKVESEAPTIGNMIQFKVRKKN